MDIAKIIENANINEKTRNKLRNIRTAACCISNVNIDDI